MEGLMMIKMDLIAPDETRYDLGADISFTAV